MTFAELKQYLSEHRRDDERFSQALEELLKRDPNPVIYSKDMPLEEQEKILMEKIGKLNSDRQSKERYRATVDLGEPNVP